MLSRRAHRLAQQSLIFKRMYGDMRKSIEDREIETRSVVNLIAVNHNY